MSQLVSESSVFPMPGGNVLEITFRGIHEWPHGNEMNRYIEAKLAETHAAAILFNLLEYEYVFGNDVTGLFTSSFHPKGERLRPVCIAASGTTYRSLYGFFKSAKLIDAFPIEFATSVESALQRLRERLGENSV